MIPGEIVGTHSTQCCGKELKIEVLRSNAGYYIGFFCDQCGPYSRESGYYRTHEEAQRVLNSDNFGRL